MAEIEYNVVASGEVKVDVYGGDKCDEHTPYIEAQHDGDMESERLDEFSFNAKRWPAGTKILVQVPQCPECETDAELQDEQCKCECGFDWKIWAEERYS